MTSSRRPTSFGPGGRWLTVTFGLQRLNARLVATGTATYGKIQLGYLDARVLRTLWRGGPSRAAGISRELQVSEGAISRSASKLRRFGLVQFDDDGRRLTLTPSGLEREALVTDLARERGRRLTEGMSIEEIAHCETLLDRLAENMSALDDYAGGPAA